MTGSGYRSVLINEPDSLKRGKAVGSMFCLLDKKRRRLGVVCIGTTLRLSFDVFVIQVPLSLYSPVLTDIPIIPFSDLPVGVRALKVFISSIPRMRAALLSIVGHFYKVSSTSTLTWGTLLQTSSAVL